MTSAEAALLLAYLAWPLAAKYETSISSQLISELGLHNTLGMVVYDGLMNSVYPKYHLSCPSLALGALHEVCPGLFCARISYLLPCCIQFVRGLSKAQFSSIFFYRILPRLYFFMCDLCILFYTWFFLLSFLYNHFLISKQFVLQYIFAILQIDRLHILNTSFFAGCTLL